MCTGHDSSSVRPKEGEKTEEKWRERRKIDGRGRKENVRDKKKGVMEKGEKQRQNTFTPQIEKKVTRSKTQRS